MQFYQMFGVFGEWVIGGLGRRISNLGMVIGIGDFSDANYHKLERIGEWIAMNGANLNH